MMMLHDVVENPEQVPDLVEELQLLPICLTFHKTPNELDEMTDWEVDMLRRFVQMKNMKEEMRIKEMEQKANQKMRR